MDLGRQAMDHRQRARLRLSAGLRHAQAEENFCWLLHLGNIVFSFLCWTAYRRLLVRTRPDSLKKETFCTYQTNLAIAPLRRVRDPLCKVLSSRWTTNNPRYKLVEKNMGPCCSESANIDKQSLTRCLLSPSSETAKLLPCTIACVILS